MKLSTAQRIQLVNIKRSPFYREDAEDKWHFNSYTPNQATIKSLLRNGLVTIVDCNNDYVGGQRIVITNGGMLALAGQL